MIYCSFSLGKYKHWFSFWDSSDSVPKFWWEVKVGIVFSSSFWPWDLLIFAPENLFTPLKWSLNLSNARTCRLQDPQPEEARQSHRRVGDTGHGNQNLASVFLLICRGSLCILYMSPFLCMLETYAPVYGLFFCSLNDSFWWVQMKILI